MTQRSRSLKRHSCLAKNPQNKINTSGNASVYFLWAAKREVECDMIPKQDIAILYKHGTGICLGKFSYQRRGLSDLKNWMATRQWPVL